MKIPILGRIWAGAQRIQRAVFSPFEAKAPITPAQPVDGLTLSRETREHLAQKAHVAPPPPPVETRRKPNPAPTARSKASEIRGQDEQTGRLFSGSSLTGPLLLEDPAHLEGLNFSFDQLEDFVSLRSAGKVLGQLSSEQLHAPATGEPQAVIAGADSSFAYFGVQDGKATIVQKFEDSQRWDHPSKPGQVRLHDGQVAFIARGTPSPQAITFSLPSESLDNLAQWGRNLLAIA